MQPQWPNQPRAAAAVGIQGRSFGMGSGGSNGGNDSNGNSCGWSSRGGSPSVNFDDLRSECSFVCFFFSLQHQLFNFSFDEVLQKIN